MERTIFALPEGKDRKGPVYITSEYLMPYLAGADYFDGRKNILDNNLVVDFLPEYAKILYEAKKDGYVFTQEQRESISLKRSEADTIKNSFLKAAFLKRVDEIEKIFAVQSAVERSGVVYLDPNSLKLQTTDPKHGEFASGSVDTFDIYEKGFDPIFEMHTHPYDRLPSPIDYWRMLAKLTDSNFRLVRGIVVLCPNCQIMALADHNTLLIDPDKLDEVIKNYKNFGKKDEEKYDDSVSRYHRSQEDLENYPNIAVAEVISTVLELESYYFKGLVAKEEFEVLLKNVYEEQEKKSKVEIEKLAIKLDKAQRKYFDVEGEVINRNLLEFARYMGIRLYISTDSRNFTAFAA